MHTLVDLLARRAAEHPARRVFTFLRDTGDADTITYGALHARAREVAGAIAAVTREVQGEQPRALLLVPQSLAFIEALFGCFQAGACAVPAHVPSAAQSRQALTRLRRIAQDARPHVVIATRATLEARAVVPELAAAAWVVVDDLGATAEVTPPGGDDLAILQYSSGSTGEPRGVMVTHANLIHNEALIEEAFEHSPSTVVLGWLPFQHDMGLIGNVLQPVYAGAECILMTPTAFLKQPLRWLREISAHRATTSGAPNFAYEACIRQAEERGCDGLDLSSWTLAFVGAEPVRPGTMERFVEMFAPHGFSREALYPCYGLAEATLMVTGGARKDPFRTASLGRPRVGCGWARHGQEVAIVEPATRRRTGEDGEIWVRGPSVARGYFGKPSEATFAARIEGEEGTWLRTGDLGRLVDGELYVTGRLKDVAIVKGVKHVAEDIEHTVAGARDRALREGACAVFSLDRGDSEELVVIQEIERGADAAWNDVAERIATAVIGDHGVRADVVSLVRTGAIPRTTSGKVRRGACRELFAQGGFEEVHRYTRPAAR